MIVSSPELPCGKMGGKSTLKMINTIQYKNYKD